MLAAVFGLFALIAPPAQPAPNVKTLEWMTGCWTSQRGEATSFESWTKANDEVMFGVSYTLGRAGKLDEFEFLRVAVRDGRLVYLAQPGGNPVTVFALTPGSNSREAVFANPAHDFPKRVGYRATPTGLLAWIDGGDAAPGRRMEFPMTRVSCDSGPK
jgi:hypothetical protein